MSYRTEPDVLYVVSDGTVCAAAGEHVAALRDNLANCIGCGCLSLTACPYTNPGDVLGDEGPGARRLLTEL